jgi:hypothetical protein
VRESVRGSGGGETSSVLGGDQSEPTEEGETSRGEAEEGGGRGRVREEEEGEGEESWSWEVERAAAREDGGIGEEGLLADMVGNGVELLEWTELKMGVKIHGSST